MLRRTTCYYKGVDDFEGYAIIILHDAIKNMSVRLDVTAVLSTDCIYLTRR